MTVSTPTLLPTLSGVSTALEHWFPLPKTLFPPAAGIDISDTSLKWIVLEKGIEGGYVRSAGEASLADGIVVNGMVEDVASLADGLAAVREKLGGIDCAHAALPEESAYVFNMHVSKESSREQVRAMVEFELEGRVPISPSAAIYDYDVIQSHDGAGVELAVAVFPRELAENYAEAFRLAGLRLLSLELESRSAARAVSSGSPNEPVSLLVDFGKLRTGLAVLKRGIPIFTSTVMVGGQMMDVAIQSALSLSQEEVTKFKNEQGLLVQGKKRGGDIGELTQIATSLADEIARHHHYWDTRRNEQGERVTPVERVLLLGGNANLLGLDDFIAAKVQAEVVRPNVWQRVCSFDEYIPPIDRHVSLEYATAIGLALRTL